MITKVQGVNLMNADIGLQSGNTLIYMFGKAHTNVTIGSASATDRSLQSVFGKIRAWAYRGLNFKLTVPTFLHLATIFYCFFTNTTQ